MEAVLDFIKALGVGRRHPHDDFLKQGNEDCDPLKVYGICEFDNEDFYHKPYPSFSCHLPGCERTFETVMQYEAHYNSCHSFTCKECNRNLPNYHLLDLHISETHDSFFMELSKRKPMFKCFLEECKECFQDSQQRRDHCIKIHKFPCDFRFDAARKKVGPGKKHKAKSSSNKKMDTDEPIEDRNKMDVTESKNVKSNILDEKKNKPKHFKEFSFGHIKGRRKPVFHNFSKDLMDSLPKE